MGDSLLLTPLRLLLAPRNRLSFLASGEITAPSSDCGSFDVILRDDRGADTRRGDAILYRDICIATHIYTG